jgi:glycosyltransferase involved in cell wall biosynthesis
MPANANTPSPAPSLDFSVVIPTRGRTRQLAACLDALARQDYPRDRYEVVVVDDGGDSHADPRIVALGERLALRLVAQAHAGPALARNRGVAHARGAWLAFTDDDCLPDRGWLGAFARRLDAAPHDAIGGRTVNALPGDPCAAASQDLVAFLYDWHLARPGEARFFATNNLALATDRFRELGGFDPGWSLAAAEDRDLCDRWRGRGWGMSYAADAVVGHAHAMTLATFARQHYTYGRGAAWLRLARLARGQRPLGIESPRFYARMLAWSRRDKRGADALHAVALTMLSQLANAAGYARERLRAPRHGPVRGARADAIGIGSRTPGDD